MSLQMLWRVLAFQLMKQHLRVLTLLVITNVTKVLLLLLLLQRL